MYGTIKIFYFRCIYRLQFLIFLLWLITFNNNIFLFTKTICFSDKCVFTIYILPHLWLVKSVYIFTFSYTLMVLFKHLVYVFVFFIVDIFCSSIFLDWNMYFLCLANCVVLAIEEPLPNRDKTELARKLVSNLTNLKGCRA